MGLTVASDKPFWCSGSCCVSLYFCSTGPDWGGEVVVLADLEAEVYCSAYLGVYIITLPPLEEGLPASSPVCTQSSRPVLYHWTVSPSPSGSRLGSGYFQQG